MNADYDSDDPERNRGGIEADEREEEVEIEQQDDSNEDEQNDSDEDELDDSDDDETESDKEDSDSDDSEDDEDNGDDDGDDSDDSDEDGEEGRELDIVDRIIAFLEDDARLSKCIRFFPDLEVEWDVLDWIGELTDQGMDSLLNALKEDMSGSESGWDHSVTHLAVLLSHPSHDMEFALRVSKILDCLTLASLEEVCIHFFDEDVDYCTPLVPLRPLVVDHYVKWMTTAPCIPRPEKLSTVRFECLGQDPKVWEAFVARFSSIREVELAFAQHAGRCPHGALHATSLAAGMGRLPLLRTLGIEVEGAGLSSILYRLSRAFGLLRSLEKVRIFFRWENMFGNDRDHDDIDLVLDEVCRGLAMCPSLKDVYV
jgi:hypothetical protein